MWYAASKRSFDIVCASIGLLVLAPMGLVIALLVKLSDVGPIFYRQTRVGQFGKPFSIWKFRSMVVNADKIGVPLTKEEDPRITWIGRFLRKTMLDDLPRLWNVLIGDMSFVGPRPQVPRGGSGNAEVPGMVQSHHARGGGDALPARDAGDPGRPQTAGEAPRAQDALRRRHPPNAGVDARRIGQASIHFFRSVTGKLSASWII